MENYFREKWDEDIIQAITMDKNKLETEMDKLAAFMGAVERANGVVALLPPYRKKLGHRLQKKKRKTKTKTTNKTKPDLILDVKFLSERVQALEAKLQKEKKLVKSANKRLRDQKQRYLDVKEKVLKLEKENKKLSEYYDRFDIMDL